MTATPEPGIHADISFADYLSWPLMSNSQLGLMAESPAHWKHAHDTGTVEETAAMAFGSAAHTALLEPTRYLTKYVTGPDVKLNTKAGKEEWAKAVDAFPNRTVLRFADGMMAERLRDSAHANPRIHKLLCGKGRNELSMVWDDAETGVRCKGRMDRFTSVDGYAAVTDLKLMSEGSPRKFSRSLAGYGYHRQAAMYLDGLQSLDKAAGRDPLQRRYIFVVGEKQPPYPFGLYELDEESLRSGRILYQGLLRRYVRCRDKDYWPGYTDGQIESISIPPWEMVDMGDQHE